MVLLEDAASEIAERRATCSQARTSPEPAVYREPPSLILDSFADALLEAPFLFGEEVTYFMTRIESTRRLIRMYALGLANAARTSDQDHRQIDFQALVNYEEYLGLARSQVRAEFASYLRLDGFRAWPSVH